MRSRTAVAVAVAFAAGSLAYLSLCQRPVSAEAEQPTNWMMNVCQDESSLERVVAQYIKEKDGVEPDYRYIGDNNEDLYLHYTLSPENAPSIPLVVDTMISGRNDQGGVNERCFMVKGYYVLPDRLKTPEMRAKILEILNTHMQQAWAPHQVYLDSDGDIAFASFINIPGPDVPVHAEMVRDIVIRSLQGWESLYGRLSAQLDLTVAAPAATSPAPQP